MGKGGAEAAGEVVIDERYRVIREIGAGRMGTVYECEHVKLGKRVALKTLLPHFARDAELVERFQQEARAASAIGNAHIIDVTDLGTLPAGEPYLAMELLRGRSLASLLDERDVLTVGRTVRIVRQICDALAAAHEKGIVHRGMKPENVFLTTVRSDPDFVKVLDFGISNVQSDEPAERQLTATGAMIGTPAYMSPEQAAGATTVGPKADVWAVGVLIYEMLAGVQPFDGESAIISREPTPLTAVRRDVPPQLSDIVLSCLAKNLDDRIDSMLELGEALAPFEELDADPELIREIDRAISSLREKNAEPGADAAAPAVGTIARAPTPGSVPPPPQRSLAVPLAIGAAVVLLVAGAVGLSFVYGAEEAPPRSTRRPTPSASAPASTTR